MTAEQAQAAASALAERAVMELRTIWPDIEGQDGVLMRERIMGILPDLVGPHYEAAAGLASDWYTATRPAGAPPFTPILAERVGTGRFRALVGEAMGPIFQAEPNYVWTQEKIEGTVEAMVLTGFRETIQLSSEADEAAESWTRVLSPGACSWCRTKAGETYHTAGQYKSHHHCRCTNAPNFKHYPDPEPEIEFKAETRDRMQASIDKAKAELVEAMNAAKQIQSQVEAMPFTPQVRQQFLSARQQWSQGLTAEERMDLESRTIKLTITEEGRLK